MKKILTTTLGLALATSSFATINCVKNENCATDQLEAIAQNNNNELSLSNYVMFSYDNKNISINNSYTKIHKIILEQVYTDVTDPSIDSQNLLNIDMGKTGLKFTGNIKKSSKSQDNFINETNKDNAEYFFGGDSQILNDPSNSIYFGIALDIDLKLEDEEFLLKDMYLLFNEDNRYYIGGRNCNYNSSDNFLTCTAEGKEYPKLHIYRQNGYFNIKIDK